MSQFPGFSAEWLALRESIDARSRSVRLTREIATALPHEALRAVDLAAGTGANARFLAEHLPARQDWLLVDHDPALLQAARVERRSQETGRELRMATLDTDLAALAVFPANTVERIFANRQLVTASALLDLVSEGWLRALAARCRASGARVLFALTYDGTIQCFPEEPDDHQIRDLVNRHQRTDKGFGAALGPDAAVQADRILTEAGYEVTREPSAWHVPPEMSELQRRLIDGWADAALELASREQGLSLASGWIERWRAHRLAHVAEGRSRLVVGHEDLAGWLRS